jgi:2-polyprenyl-3-methyl-5-hydroxy-6-metoxy-1,4-benzoquinol methylase
MLNHNECQCCGFQKMKSIDRIGEYEQIACDGCGYVRFVHRSEEVNHQLYETDTDYNDDLDVAKDFEDFIQWNHNKAMQYLNTKYPDGKACVLDVGCFTGFFVKKLLQLGFNAHGVDFNNKALDFGKKHYGLDNSISNETLQELLVQGKKFDVISLFEVIEHLENIGEVLSQVSILLKDGGIIIISTPNSKMCWRPALDFPPHHLSRFTPDALRIGVTHFGFQPILMLEQMGSYDLIRNYVGTFFREKNKTSLRGGAFKNKSSIRVLRIAMNKLKRVGGVLFFPLDKLLYALGLRYICQLVIAEKK